MRSLSILIVAAVAVASCRGDDVRQKNSLLPSSTASSARTNNLIKPPALPRLLKIPVLFQRMREESVLADIVNRCERPSLGNGRATDGHESSHMLAAQLRNAAVREGQGTVNAFYLLEGNYALVKEPGIRKSVVAPFVPASLREYRFATYVTGAPDWEREPLYIAEEWAAYINGCLVAYDDVQTKRFHERADEASGVIELGIYSVAMAMAVEKHDPEYFRNDAQFKPFLLYQWTRAKEVYDKAHALFPSDRQDNLVKNLQSSPDAEKMRTFIRTHLDGVWLEAAGK